MFPDRWHGMDSDVVAQVLHHAPNDQQLLVVFFTEHGHIRVNQPLPLPANHRVRWCWVAGRGSGLVPPKLGDAVSERARLRVNLAQCEFEVEGSEAFVRTYAERFDALLDRLGRSL